MAWNLMHHTMLRVVTIWALLNGSAIAFLTALFFAERAWSSRMRKRPPGRSGPIVPISGGMSGR